MITKTLNEILTEHTDEEVFNNILDAATIEELKDYFYYRHVCDDSKFIRFFQRNMRQLKNQYNEYLRIQNIEFDPMVTRYLEQQITGTSQLNRNMSTYFGETYSKNKNHNATEGVVERSNGNSNATIDNTRTLDHGSATSYSDTSSANETHNDVNKGKNINSQFAQANPGNLTMDPDAVSIDYATSSDNSRSQNNGGSQNQSSGSGSSRVDNTGTISDVGHNIAQMTESKNKDTTKGGTESESFTRGGDNATRGTDKTDTDQKTRYTGRENYKASDLLEAARDYISTTNAFLWLVNKLEICFIGNLRYGEEELC